nr:hypothetical protein [Micromonospora sp. DSM 115978]
RETHTKAAGVLTALGLLPTPTPTTAKPATTTATRTTTATATATANRTEDVGSAGRPAAVAAATTDPAVVAALAARNVHLARFWTEQRNPGAAAVPALTGRRALVVDGEDTFTGMLAHQLRGLGLAVTVRPWQRVG